MLVGRDPELRTIERLIDGARAGAGGALVVVGDPGIGKTALLQQAVERASPGMRVLRVTGAESEAELPYSALHLLLGPVADRIGLLPDPQAAALRAAFGMEAAAGVDPFLAGLATLTLLSELAAECPLLCVVDDGQCADVATVEAMRLAARRIQHDPIALLVATRGGRPPDRALPPTDLPVLRLGGLSAEASAALMDREAPGLPARLRDRVLGTAGGNPLALLELPRAAGAGEAWGPGPLPITERLERAFRGQADRLGDAARTLLLVVAADDTGSLGTVMHAAGLLVPPAAALAEAERSGLVVVTGGSVRFRHPLVRTAVYQGALFTQRQAVHHALARVLRDGDRHRRAWHLAAAAIGPDETAAAALEEAAEDAARRSGQSAAMRAYERAAQLSERDGDRARRLAAAVRAAVEAGAFGRAEELCDAAAPLTRDPAVLAGLAGARSRLAFERGMPRTAARVALDGAKGIAGADPVAAAELLVLGTYYAGHGVDTGLTGEAAALLDALHLPSDHPFRPYMRQARAFHRLSTGEAPDPAAFAVRRPRTLWEQTWTARVLNISGNAVAALEVATDMVAAARAGGSAGHLANALFHEAGAQLVLGRHRAAAEAAGPALTVAVETGQGSVAAYLRGLLAWLAAAEGDADRCRALAGEAIRYADDHGAPPSGADATWALALLDLGKGRYDAALATMENRWPFWPCSSAWLRSAADHLEAAHRAGSVDVAARLMDGLDAASGRILDPCGPAVLARCRALLASGDEAEAHHVEAHYAEALRPGPCDDRPFDRARTLLCYGEWLRREHRKADARVPLRTAFDLFRRCGAVLWAERARAELRATGDRSVQAPADAGAASRLTPQELQVVRLAATGATNRDIAATLFLSPRTIAQHLYRAYPKLGISTRTELAALDLGT